MSGRSKARNDVKKSKLLKYSLFWVHLKVSTFYSVYKIISRQILILLKLKDLRVAASIHQLLALDFNIYFVLCGLV